MKKLVSLILALALCLGLAAPALAVEYTPQTHKCYWCEDNTVLTIDKVAFIDYKYHIPVGATITYTVSETGHYEGAVGHLCISSAYYFTNDAPTIVHWSYDPAVGAMVRTDSAEYVSHSNCPDLPAGASYTFTITEEMAESTAIFNSLDYYGVNITAGCFTDAGSEISTRTILGIPDSTTPVEPETPDEPVDDTPAGETIDDAPTGETLYDAPTGETGEYTETDDWYGTTITVDAVSVETTTISVLGESDGPYVPEEIEVTLVTVTPDTVVSVKNADGNSDTAQFTCYSKTEDGAYAMSYEMGNYVSDGETFNVIYGDGYYPLVKHADAYILIDPNATASTSTETSTTPTTTTPTTTPVEGGVVYTVKQFDTMGKISLNYYGSYGYHRELYKANSEAFAKTGGHFNTGMTLILPDTLAGKARLAEPTLAEGESFYTVKAGDTLGAIAAATYGDIMMYEEIYERNADRLKNANTIFEGQVIVLPAK